MNKESTLQKLWQMNRGFPVAIASLIVLNLAFFAIGHWGLAPTIDKLERRFIHAQAQARKGGGADRLSPGELHRLNSEGLESFGAMLGDRTEFTAFAGEIFALADRAKLPIESVGYKPEVLEDQGLLRYSLSFSVTGDYGKLKKFIFSLEQSQRLIIIEKMGLRGSGEREQGEVTLGINLVTYFKTVAS